MKHSVKYYLLLLIASISHTFAQNLVPNPSFENYSTCPNNMGQISNCLFWVDGGDISSSSSTDYYNSCSVNMNVPFPNPVPWYSFYQESLTGNSYIGIATYYSFGSSSNEFAQVKLIDTLIYNKWYYVEFYVNLPEKTHYVVNDLGCYFSNSQINAGINNYSPQLQNNINNDLDDTLRWERIKGFYKAAGNEQWITIGNFTPFGNETKSIADSNYIIDQSYYLIDEVGVYEITNWELWDAGPDKYISLGDSVIIGNPCGDYSIFEWQNALGNATFLNDSTIPQPYAKPTQTTTYYVNKIQPNDTLIDSVTVHITSVGINSTHFEAVSLSIYPNPNEGIAYIAVANNKSKQLAIEVMDISGKLVYKSTAVLTNGTGSLNLHLENGIYIVKLLTNIGEGKVLKMVISK